jgi:hypothetical protein
MDVAALIGMVCCMVLAGVLLFGRANAGAPPAGARGVIQKWLRPKCDSTVPAAKVRGRVWLTPQHSVHVIECDGQTFVIGCHAGGLTKLSERITLPRHE